MTRLADLPRVATTQLSAASGAVFRIGFGLVGVLLVVRFFVHGWIDLLYVDPAFHFTYPGFEWVTPLPPAGMYALFALMGLSALAVALGFHHRLFALLFAGGLAYVELIDRTLYLNHYYWLVLTGALIAFLPLSNSYSVDALRGRVTAPGWLPAWVVWLLRFQVGMVYVFAGLAKINADWLLQGEPLGTWLPARSELWFVGPLLTSPMTALVLSWAGALFDLTIVLWLSLRRTRPWAYAALVLFHLLTWILFPSIGLFPLVMSVGATVFFAPDWPASLRSPAKAPEPSRPRVRPPWVAVATLYVLAMLLVPIRHHFIAGDVAWAGRGYLGSWQVMLTERSGSVEFLVTDPDSGDTWRVGPPDYLTERQTVVMATDPALIAMTAELVSGDHGGLPVAADARLSVNGRPSAQLTDPEVVITGGESEQSGEWVLATP